MKNKYFKNPEARDLKILGALADGTATDKEIEIVVNDINEHLKAPAGTLQNYNGRFKRAGLKSLQKNYGLFSNEEFYSSQKILKLYNSLISADKKYAKINPQLLKMIVDYLKGNEENGNVKYITIGYASVSNGN